MFGEFLNGDYRTHRFLLKGTSEQIEKIKNTPEYEVEILSEEHDPDRGVSVIEVSQYTYVEDIISENPEIMAAGFVEDWDEWDDVYVAFSSKGSSGIDNCIRVGYFDGHNDFNWHDSCLIIARNHEVKMGYSGEYETATYDFPFYALWDSI